MAEPVRLRVVFDDRHLLTKPQRANGLRRCCLLLRSELSTISDLAAYLADAFALRCSCADGLLLSMDDFVLPPFESTDIFRDMDIVRVRKKVMKKKLLAVSDGPNHFENFLIMSKEPALPDQATLVSTDSKEDFGEDENKMGEDNGHIIIVQTSANKVTHSKRKRAQSDKPQGKKKQKLSRSEDLIEAEENIQSLKNENVSHLKGNPSETFIGTDKPSKMVERFDMSNSLNDDQRKDSAGSMEERHGEIEENSFGTSSDTHPADSNKKIPSRSSRRKKAKRHWRKEMAKHQQNQELANDMQIVSSEKQTEDQINEVQKELIPILVRPGHIRFDDEDGEKSILQSNGTHACSNVEHVPLQWNGTTNKKKGQKWGRDKTFNTIKEDAVCNVASLENLRTEERKFERSLDFESLYPLTRLPMEGDVVVYRLVELSSSWCPEISPFRVGKVISYDQMSLKVVLVPVPEYPILPDEVRDEESAEQPNNLLYGEDGSLEIDYPSLVDVRLLSAYNSEVITVNNISKEKNKEASTQNNWELAVTGSNVKQASLTASEPSSGMGCEQADQALNETQVEKDGWGSWIPNKSTSTSWSYRVMRASALGPTLSFLRGKSSKRSGSSNKHTAAGKSGKY